MSIFSDLLITTAICIVSALLEGLFAGKNVKPFLKKLRSPWYAPPLSVWIVIGGLYYVIFFFLIYRILRHEGDEALRTTALVLALLMMAINAFYNYVFFRAQNLFYCLLTGIPYIPAAIALFACLLALEPVAAWVFFPYLLYLIYVSFLGYKFWKLNPDLS